MKSKKTILSALILTLSLLAVPAIQAGDGPAAPSAKCSSSKQVHTPLYSRLVKPHCPRCAERCSRVMWMLHKRGCLCPGVARAIHPVRSYSYLSNHYPPFR